MKYYDITNFSPIVLYFLIPLMSQQCALPCPPLEGVQGEVVISPRPNQVIISWSSLFFKTNPGFQYQPE